MSQKGKKRPFLTQKYDYSEDWTSFFLSVVKCEEEDL